MSVTRAGTVIPDTSNPVPQAGSQKEAAQNEIVVEVSPPRTPLRFHPLADLFPQMTTEEREALREGIAKHGVRTPILVQNGMILDGRHRYEISLALGIACPTVEYLGDDPLGEVISANLHRRHLDASQRALVAARIATLKQGPNRVTGKIAGVSQAEAAKLLNVSKRLVRSAHGVLDHGDPVLIGELDRGEIKVSKAAAKVRAPKDSTRPLPRIRVPKPRPNNVLKSITMQASADAAPRRRGRLLQRGPPDRLRRAGGSRRRTLRAGEARGHLARDAAWRAPVISDHDEDDVVGIATRAELEALAATAPGLDRVPEPLRPLALQMARAGVVNALRAGDPQMRAALRAHRARRAVQAQGSETPQPPAQPSTSPTTSRAPAPTSPSPEADAPPEREPPEPAPPPATPRRRRRIRFPFRDDHDTPPAA